VACGDLVGHPEPQGVDLGRDLGADRQIDLVPGGPFRFLKRPRVVGVFPIEESLVNLATVVMLRATEDWALRRYLDMAPLWAAEEKPTKIAA